MDRIKWSWVIRILAGALLGAAASVVLASNLADARGPSPEVFLLCAALGAAAGAATLPFADDGRALLLRSGTHFGVTALLFGLLAARLGARGTQLLAMLAMLAVLYALIWLGRWIGWYMEVVSLRTMMGLAPGPSPLKWRETLPYLPFALLLCDGLPLLMYWADHMFSGDVPVLSGLLLPYVLLPAAGFSSGMSLGRRRGLCPLYPIACFLCYLPMVFLLYNSSAMFHCFMVAVPALAGDAAGWLRGKTRSSRY